MKLLSRKNEEDAPHDCFIFFVGKWLAFIFGQTVKYAVTNDEKKVKSSKHKP